MDDRNSTELLVARDIVTTLAGPYADPDPGALQRVRVRLQRRAERARPRRTWLWRVAVPAAAAATVAAVALTGTALMPRATTPPPAEPPAVQVSESVSAATVYQLPLRDPYEVVTMLYSRWNRHFGVDLACPEGTPFYSVHAGTVTVAGDYGGYGTGVMVDDGAGVVVVYGHASSLAVTVGTSVAAGDLLGYVGHSGYAVSDHLHLEVLVDGGEYDPVRFLRDRGVELMPDGTR